MNHADNLARIQALRQFPPIVITHDSDGRYWSLKDHAPVIVVDVIHEGLIAHAPFTDVDGDKQCEHCSEERFVYRSFPCQDYARYLRLLDALDGGDSNG